MKYPLLGALACALANPAFALCQYPLDATTAQYAQTGFTPFPEILYQSATYTVHSTLVPPPQLLNIENYIAASANGVQSALNVAGTTQVGGDITLPASGIVAVEFSIDRFASFSTPNANMNLTLGFATPNNNPAAPGATFGLMFNNMLSGLTVGGGSWAGLLAMRRENSQTTYSPTASNLPLTLPLAAGYRAGIYLNMTTRQMGFTMNGVDYGYVKDAAGNPFTIPAGIQSGLLMITGILQVASDTDPLIGTPIGASLITDRSQFTQPFPAGTADICGNTGAGTGGHHDHDDDDDDHGHHHGKDKHDKDDKHPSKAQNKDDGRLNQPFFRRKPLQLKRD